MVTGDVRSLVTKTLSRLWNEPGLSISLSPVPGGSINDSYRVKTSGRDDLFLKVNASQTFPALFETERYSLDHLARHGVKTPLVVLQQTIDDQQLLLLSWVNPGNKTNRFWKKFGEQLAVLHFNSAGRFGFDRDNYIGSLPQSNRNHDRWTDFLQQERLQPQVVMAAKKALLKPHHLHAFDRLYPLLPGIFNEEKPALLHGDLWSGNFLCDESEDPVFIDPATYYGHRSMEFAMTSLFGGFDPLFYEAYHHHYPLPPDYQDQWRVGQLYPLLVHLNLFGTSYLGDIESILDRYAG